MAHLCPKFVGTDCIRKRWLSSSFKTSKKLAIQSPSSSKTCATPWTHHPILLPQHQREKKEEGVQVVQIQEFPLHAEPAKQRLVQGHVHIGTFFGIFQTPPRPALGGGVFFRAFISPGPLGEVDPARLPARAPWAATANPCQC